MLMTLEFYLSRNRSQNGMLRTCHWYVAQTNDLIANNLFQPLKVRPSFFLRLEFLRKCIINISPKLLDIDIFYHGTMMRHKEFEIINE